jgi:hypothetical protein
MRLAAGQPKAEFQGPGTYRVTLAKRVGGKVTVLGETREFKVVLGRTTRSSRPPGPRRTSVI